MAYTCSNIHTIQFNPADEAHKFLAIFENAQAKKSTCQIISIETHFSSLDCANYTGFCDVSAMDYDVWMYKQGKMHALMNLRHSFGMIPFFKLTKSIALYDYLYYYITEFRNIPNIINKDIE